MEPQYLWSSAKASNSDHAACVGHLQRVSSTDAIKREDADQCREHVEDVVQTADPSVQG